MADRRAQKVAYGRKRNGVMVLRNEIHLSATVEISPSFFEICLGMSKEQFMNRFTLEYKKEVLVPRRTHKKKRIRKKWLKRYGYKTDIKPAKFENVSIREVELLDDGTSTFDVYL